MTMTWEQKFAAIKAIARSATVEMRKPGDWYVGAGMEHADGSSFLIGNYGNGSTPEEAVEDHWRLYGDGTPFKVRDSWFRWNGFMWENSERPRQ